MFDLPLAELQTYRPPIEQPEDLADFWRGSLAEVRRFELGLSVQPVENRLAVIDTFDVRFAGWGGSEVRAWLHLPAGRRAEPLPTVVHYFGYSARPGLPP